MFHAATVATGAPGVGAFNGGDSSLLPYLKRMLGPRAWGWASGVDEGVAAAEGAVAAAPIPAPPEGACEGAAGEGGVALPVAAAVETEAEVSNVNSGAPTVTFSPLFTATFVITPASVALTSNATYATIAAGGGA